MKVNELRIGNLVLGRGRETVKVRDILEYGINSETDYYGVVTCEYSESYISGIPLTEEWLVRFGFEMYCGDWTKKGVQIGEYEEQEGETTFKFSIMDVVSFNPIEIKHVHQLQNLYFALTGEELTLRSGTVA